MHPTDSPAALLDPKLLLAELQRWSKELGFARLGVGNIDLAQDEAHFLDWLSAGFNGEMAYMARHGVKRSRPAELLPGTVSCISVRMDYWPEEAADAEATLADASVGYVSRYALGRDYHKLMRARLQQLCDRITGRGGTLRPSRFHRQRAGSGKGAGAQCRPGLDRQAHQSDRPRRRLIFFSGRDLPGSRIARRAVEHAHCGTCSACIPACPTGAIVAPYRLDARRCISYLTIELAGAIPVEFRRAIGNRIYGCDDCQLACPWNKFARPTAESDFAVRHGLDHAQLAALFSWSETQFLERTAGSAIRRIGHERWLRNIAVALGNAPTSPAIIESLRSRAEHPSAVVREHVQWALAQHVSRQATGCCPPD